MPCYTEIGLRKRWKDDIKEIEKSIIFSNISHACKKKDGGLCT